MPNEIRHVGFVGLGRMGTPMALNILKAGFQVTVYNRSPAKMKPLIEKGARGAASPKEAATGADVVITCLLDDKSVLDQVTGNNGILAGLKAGGIHIGATTVSPACSTRLAELHKEAGSIYLAGPVVGRPDAAEAGQLLAYVAGDPDAIAKCAQLFAAYTRAVTNVGTNPAVANSVKLGINFMVISLVEMMGQVYAFAEKSGIDLSLMGEQINMILTHPAMPAYARRIRTREFEPAAFELTTGLKDVLLMLQASTEARAPLPYASIIREKLVTALANGMGHKDWSAIYEVTRYNAGLP